jgi:hypothetical protein
MTVFTKSRNWMPIWARWIHSIPQQPILILILRTGRSGVRISAGAGNFSPHHRVQTCPEVHPASCPGHQVLFPWKRPGSEDDHSPPSIAEVRDEWSYTSTPQYSFMVLWWVKKHRDKFTFTSHLLGIFFFYLCHRVQAGSVVHPAFFPIGRGSCFHGSEASI